MCNNQGNLQSSKIKLRLIKYVWNHCNHKKIHIYKKKPSSDAEFCVSQISLVHVKTAFIISTSTKQSITSVLQARQSQINKMVDANAVITTHKPCWVIKLT